MLWKKDLVRNKLSNGVSIFKEWIFKTIKALLELKSHLGPIKWYFVTWQGKEIQEILALNFFYWHIFVFHFSWIYMTWNSAKYGFLTPLIIFIRWQHCWHWNSTMCKKTTHIGNVALSFLIVLLYITRSFPSSNKFNLFGKPVGDLGHQGW